MRNLLMIAALAFAGVAGCSKDKSDSSATAKADEYPSMTVDEVDKAVAAKEAQAVDCNGDRTRKKYGVVPGAILITDDEAYPASELPADKTTKLVFYCSDPG